MNKPWIQSTDSAEEWQIITKGYMYCIQQPVDGKCYARRLNTKYPWLMDIDANGKIVQGCTEQGTTFAEAKRRCELVYQRRFHVTMPLSCT